MRKAQSVSYKKEKISFVQKSDVLHGLVPNDHTGADAGIDFNRAGVGFPLARKFLRKESLQQDFIGHQKDQRRKIGHGILPAAIPVQQLSAGDPRTRPALHEIKEAGDRVLGQYRIRIQQQGIASLYLPKGQVVRDSKTQIMVVLVNDDTGILSFTASTLPSEEPLSTSQTSWVIPP
jgi:hypothetical protein